MSTPELQDRLDQLADGETLTLDPPRKEFKGPLVIRKPVRIEGQNGTICARAGPILQIEAAGVVLRDLNVDVTGRDAPTDGDGACALVVQPGLSVALENVAVRGNVLGLEDEEGVWRAPRSLNLGALQPAVPHEFTVSLQTPVACTLESEIDGLKVEPPDLESGTVTVTLQLDGLPSGTRLRGNLLLRTRQLVRRIVVSGHFNEPGTTGNGQVLWRPEGGAVAPDVGTAPPPLPVSTGGATPSSPPSKQVARSTLAGTLVVSAVEDGCLATIGEALRRAPSGGRVLVRPGVYKESLTISKKIEIVADGPADSVAVESVDGNCLLMQADLARVRGLTLRGASGRQGRGRYAVSVPTGKLILEDCRITSDTLACVAATGGSATAELRRCRVVGGASAGLFVSDKADVVLDDCDVTENALAGIECRRGGRMAVRGCRISRNGQAGVLVHELGEATLENCDIFANSQAGVEVRDDGHPVLKRCKVRNGLGAGVRLHGGQATLEDCELFENALANLEARHGGSPTLKRCRLYQGKQAGARFGRDGQGLLEDCDLFGNARAAVEILQNANPTLRRCTVRECGDLGVAIQDRGRGVLEDCDLSDAGAAVLAIRQSATPTVRRCKIHDGRRAGVFVAGRGGGTLEECEIFANKGPGVAITAEANPVLKSCQVRENGQAGVVAWDGGKGVVEVCGIVANGLAGVAILSGGGLVARGCTISRNRDVGLWADRGAEGEVEECDLTANHGGSLDVEPGAATRLEKNRVDV
jgi:Right handed beta helix region